MTGKTSDPCCILPRVTTTGLKHASKVKKHPEPVFKIIRWIIPVIPAESILLRVDSFFWYSAVFMKKGRFFQRLFMIMVTFEKEEGRPYSFAQLVYKCLITHISGSTKRIGNLNSAIEKADSSSPPKRESTHKSQCITMLLLLVPVQLVSTTCRPTVHIIPQLFVQNFMSSPHN
jgi:hypothetical protein